MARKRVVEPSGVKTWEDANDALRQIAEAQLAVQDIEGEMNKQILGAKKAAEEQSKPHKDRIAKLERELKDFVTEHRADMGKAKSKILTFGEVGFRLSTSVSLPRAKEKIEEIIRRLKNRQMMDCIVVKEDVSNLAPWTLKNCELCLMGTRGRMVQYKQKNNIPQLVEAVRTRHSEKPEEVRRRIEELFGDVPRIELFARKRFHGWDCWGNEV